MSAKYPYNVCKMSACRLFSGVFECVIFTMDKEMRKTKNTSPPSSFLLQKNKGILSVSP